MHMVSTQGWWHVPGRCPPQVPDLSFVPSCYGRLSNTQLPACPFQRCEKPCPFPIPCAVESLGPGSLLAGFLDGVLASSPPPTTPSLERCRPSQPCWPHWEWPPPIVSIPLAPPVLLLRNHPHRLFLPLSWVAQNCHSPITTHFVQFGIRWPPEWMEVICCCPPPLPPALWWVAEPSSLCRLGPPAELRATGRSESRAA